MLTKNDIEKYFIAEKQESFLFVIIGILAIVCAIVFILFLKNNFWRGAAIPLLAIGLIQVIVGYTVYKRCDADRVKVVYAYDLNPNDLKNKELPRMVTVNKKFVIYRWVEIALIVVGIILFFKYKNNATCENSWQGNALWYGLAITLTLQATIMLCADYFAEKRGNNYETQLRSFV